MKPFMCFFRLYFVSGFVKNIARKRENRISYQIGMFRSGGGGGGQNRGGVSIYPLADLDRGIHIRGGSKFASDSRDVFSAARRNKEEN